MDVWSNQDHIAVSDSNQRKFPIEWLIIFIILIIGIIALIILLIKSYSERISPDQCPTIQGSYGMIPASNGTILNLCGSGGNQPCQSLQPNLDTAVAECENQSNICNRFSYNGSNSIFMIISETNSLYSDQGTNVFTRQNNFINDSS